MHFFGIETNQEIILTKHIHGKACIKEKAKDKLKIVGLLYQVFSSISFFASFLREMFHYIMEKVYLIFHIALKNILKEKLHITI